MFPDFEAPKTEKEYLAFCASLEQHRSLQKLRHPMRYDEPLDILRPCLRPQAPPGATVTRFDSTTVAIPAPYSAPRRPRMPLDSTAQVKVVLTGKVQIGCEKFSQVYRGTLQSGECECSIVLKLYQQSMFKVPHISRFLTKSGSPVGNPWSSGTRLAQTEAWAYERLRDLQGTVVPHSYGSYLFKLPNGEEAVGLVLEELAGSSMDHAVQNILTSPSFSVSRLWQVMDAVMWAYHAIHRRGVLHQDVALRNLRIFTGNGYVAATIFDFSFARAAYDETGALYGARDSQLVKHSLFKEARISNDVVQQWKQERIKSQPRWMASFVARAKDNLFPC